MRRLFALIVVGISLAGCRSPEGHNGFQSPMSCDEFDEFERQEEGDPDHLDRLCEKMIKEPF